MVLPFKMFIGGPFGSGNQWYPWVHRDDAIAVMLYLLDHLECEGGFNVVSPESVSMRAFALELGRSPWATLLDAGAFLCLAHAFR